MIFRGKGVHRKPRRIRDLSGKSAVFQHKHMLCGKRNRWFMSHHDDCMRLFPAKLPEKSAKFASRRRVQTSRRFVGKEKLGFTRLEHGTVAGGTFAPGSSVVGSTSSATATVAYVTDGVLECVNVRGTFVPGEEIAASAIKATLQGIARVADVVLTDKASAPTVRYRQGVDYDLNARTGLLRVRESCSADTVFLTADCESSDEQLVDALTASDVTGELLFVGQPDQGPGLVVQCWKVTLSLNGEVGLISEELASIPMTGEVLADDLNHPESPFFRVRYLG